MTRFRAVVFCTVVGIALAAGGDASGGRGPLEDRCRALRLEVIRERARVMRENPAAVALRRRIEKLYRELDAVVEGDERVRTLAGELARVEAALAETARGSSPGPEAAEGTHP